MEFKGTKGKWVSSFQTGSWIIQDKESFQDDSKSALAEVYYFKDGKDTAETNALLISKSPELLENAQMHIDSLDLSQLDFYNKYGFNVSELIPKTRKLIKEATELQ